MPTEDLRTCRSQRLHFDWPAQDLYFCHLPIVDGGSTEALLADKIWAVMPDRYMDAGSKMMLGD